MRAAERDAKLAVFLCHSGRSAMSHAQRGGCDIHSGEKCGKAAFLYMPHSAVVGRFEAARIASDAGKRKGRERPPQKRGDLRPFVETRCDMSLLGPMGSLSSSFIPAGRLGTAPLSPRASSCRIGPRRQGFASPLRALDGSGPIRKTRCLRGERGGRAVGRGAGNLPEWSKNRVGR